MDAGEIKSLASTTNQPILAKFIHKAHLKSGLGQSAV